MKTELAAIDTASLPYEEVEKLTFDLVKSLYKDDQGEPICLSKSQLLIFNCIFSKAKPKVQMILPTQFGKSLVVSLGVLTRACVFAEKWAIVAPSQDKAKIIMGYVIQHIFDNPFMKSKLEIDKHESLESIRRERSKNRLVFKVKERAATEPALFSEIFIASADSRNKAEAGNALMGFGAQNVIEDEASLISDIANAKIVRMFGGYTNKKTFFMKIGNPFKRNHFFRTSRDKSYFQIFVNDEIALKEGRFTKEFLEDAKKEPLYDILYRCLFPEGELAEGKWSSLFPYDMVKNAMIDEKEVQAFGVERRGCDVGGGTGRDSSVIVGRNDILSSIIYDNNRVDTMIFTGVMMREIEDTPVDEKHFAVDGTGIGDPVCKRLREQGKKINIFISASSPWNKRRYHNRRAEIYWTARQWLNEGGKLKKDERWFELCDIMYHVDDSSGKIKIMSKGDMLERGIKSPNISDAFAMTFARRVAARTVNEMKEEDFNKMMKKRKKKKNFAKGYSLQAC